MHWPKYIDQNNKDEDTSLNNFWNNEKTLFENFTQYKKAGKCIGRNVGIKTIKIRILVWIIHRIIIFSYRIAHCSNLHFYTYLCKTLSFSDENKINLQKVSVKKAFDNDSRNLTEFCDFFISTQFVFAVNTNMLIAFESFSKQTAR